MNKLFYFILLLYSLPILSQNVVKGLVVDEKTGETLIGANILISNTEEKDSNTGTVSNINGEFQLLNLSNGNYDLNISYIGYQTSTKNITLNSEISELNITIKLNPDLMLNAVSVISDQAEFRKTPVSLSNVKLEKIERELAGQEIPILLNSTPRVYATQQGGGDGDVRSVRMIVV